MKIKMRLKLNNNDQLSSDDSGNDTSMSPHDCMIDYNQCDTTVVTAGADTDATSSKNFKVCQAKEAAWVEHI